MINTHLRQISPSLSRSSSAGSRQGAVTGRVVSNLGAIAVGVLLGLNGTVPALAAPADSPARVQVAGLRVSDAVWRQTPVPRDQVFDVYVDGHRLGQHRLHYQRDGAALQVKVDIDFAYKLSFITLFSYDHHCVERWRDGKLVSVRSNTTDGGDRYFVNVAQRDDGLMVKGTQGPGLVETPLAVSTYWNLASLLSHHRMINTQKGDLLDYTITKLDSEPVMARGQRVMADQYLVKSSLETHVWYDQRTGEWVKLKVRARGRDVEYRLVDEAGTDVAASAADVVPADETER